MSKNHNVPQVRFKGFTDAWEQRELGEHLIKNNERNKELTISNVESVSNKKGFVKQTEQFEDYSVASSDLSNYYIIRENMFAYNPSRINVGSIAYKEKGDDIAVVSPLYVSFATKNIDDKYLWYWFKTSSFEQQRQVSSEGGVRDTLSFDKVNSMQIALPSVAEQQQIGSYFRNLDNLITLHQRKCDSLKKTKKAMLQKMFPKNGENVPEIRFKGFTDAWEQREVKDVCSISTGKSNTQDKIDDGIYPFYVRSPIIEKSNRYLYDEEAVLTVGDGVGTGKVFHYVNGKYDLHQRVYRMFGFSDNMSAKYFYYYFSNHFYERVMAMTAKTSVDSVRYDMIADMDIVMPSRAEQEKVSAYFRNLDNLITLHQRKLETLKKLKKSMLQKMFP